MTVKTTLSFTDRHHAFLVRQVEAGIFASQSAAVASAIEEMIQAEEEREVMLAALSEEIRERAKTPRDEFITEDEAFADARAHLADVAEA